MPQPLHAVARGGRRRARCTQDPVLSSSSSSWEGLWRPVHFPLGLQGKHSSRTGQPEPRERAGWGEGPACPGALTVLGHVPDGHTVLLGHVPQEGEDHEAGGEARQ